MGSIQKLKDALEKKFPREETNSLAKLLSVASRKGEISWKEVKYRGGSEDDILLAFEKKLLLPVASSSLAWEDRILILAPEETYEMPKTIQYLIKEAEETEKIKSDCAIKKYLEEIGEEKIKEILELSHKMYKHASENYRISPEDLKKLTDESGLDANKIIAELKGGGIISPSFRNPKHKLQYQLNPSLFE